jgi:hypothetical protein
MPAAAPSGMLAVSARQAMHHRRSCQLPATPICRFSRVSYALLRALKDFCMEAAGVFLRSGWLANRLPLQK